MDCHKASTERKLLTEVCAKVFQIQCGFFLMHMDKQEKNAISAYNHSFTIVLGTEHLLLLCQLSSHSSCFPPGMCWFELQQQQLLSPGSTSLSWRSFAFCMEAWSLIQIKWTVSTEDQKDPKQAAKLSDSTTDFHSELKRSANSMSSSSLANSDHCKWAGCGFLWGVHCVFTCESAACRVFPCFAWLL